MIEYAILTIMVVFATGFAWLWVIEQRKRQKRKAKNGLSDSAHLESTVDVRSADDCLANWLLVPGVTGGPRLLVI